MWSRAGWGLSGSRRRRTGLIIATAGWDDDRRRACLHRVACLSRFPSWRRMPHLACVERCGPQGGRRGALRLPPVWRPLKIGMRERVFGRPTGLARPPAGGDRAATETPSCIRRTGGSASRNRACCLRRWRSALESWAEQEFGGAPLGDARLSARLVTCARHQAEAPAFTGAAKGGQGLLPFHRQAGAVTVENILQPHQTLRAGGEDGAVRAGRQFVELREAGEKGWGLPTRPVPRPAVCTCTPR